MGTSPHLCGLDTQGKRAKVEVLIQHRQKMLDQRESSLASTDRGLEVSVWVGLATHHATPWPLTLLRISSVGCYFLCCFYQN